jgi:GNAT superfamily N-acetyltransferase
MTVPARIRAAQRGDHAAIVAFNTALALETESKTLDQLVLGRGVARALTDPGRLRYWVAEAEGVVVGQAAVTREWSDWRDGWIWWFQSVYVVPDRRRQGIFRALFETIRAEARSAGDVIGLRLYVENANHHAHRTYEALGLRPGGYHVYEDLWLSVEGTDGPRSSMRYPFG